MAPCRLRWLVLLPLVVGAAVAERHYLFTAPKVSYAGESETMCLTLFDVPETGDLTLDFSGSGDRRTLHTQSSPGDQPEQLFVQTDKFVYKPGQLVRFRVFSVDSELRPVTKPIPLIFIQTPLGTRVAQWTDQSGRSGLVQLDFQLSDEPTLARPVQRRQSLLSAPPLPPSSPRRSPLRRLPTSDRPPPRFPSSGVRR
ncbi:Alpha-2-macroglobulin [Amphibalanus amphitrite]|uniref:TEP1-F n=1 Tax=Amphibalanus amphitrite TaxID=1232801 RepID=A0A6A4W899_AMPAM|nr:Alpha-2-macroglobulin [Amphibalanus amphitrite]